MVAVNEPRKPRQKLHDTSKKLKVEKINMKTSKSNHGSPKLLRKFGNDNGSLVMFALKAFKEPATADEILSLIADGKKVSEILQSVS